MADRMPDFEEVWSLLLDARTHDEKSSAYSSLLQLQERSVTVPYLLQTLVHHSPQLLSVICSDLFSDEEEIAGQALKCLGFMIYDPTLVASFSDGDTILVISSLVKVIMTTKMKVICNLGVWCIAIQQFNMAYISSHLSSILVAMIHALDNPFGSLSITYEAMQAIIKLVSQLNEMMRDMSDIWAPLIYKRLLSSDKREREMSERCLLKTKSCIFSPPLNLSKVLLRDIKQKLLPTMMDMIQDQGKHAQTVYAWGWFIRLLGFSIIKDNNLLNEMLKIPEKTFSSSDPKIQTGSLVAWEALIDGLIGIRLPNILIRHEGIDFQQNKNGEIKGLLKSIKLLMTPLIKILARSKYELSVHSACFNLWRYLLIKLDIYRNNPSIMKAALEPVVKAIFCAEFYGRNTWLWTSCLELLEQLISSEFRDCNSQTSFTRHNVIGSKSSKDGSIKLVPWDLSSLEFYLEMNWIIINRLSAATVIFESLKLNWIATLRIFRSVLQIALVKLEMPSIHFEKAGVCITTILKFVKGLCEDLTSKPCKDGLNDLLVIAIQFVEAIGEKLGASKLETSLFRVSLDLKFIKSLNSTYGTKYLKILNVRSLSYMDDVSPMVYLTILYYFVLVQLLLNYPEIDDVHNEIQRYSKYVFSWNDPYENVQAVICLLYIHGLKLEDGVFFLLKIWMSVALDLKEKIDAHGDLNIFKNELDQTGFLVVYWILCYPFTMCYVWPTTAINNSCSDVCLEELELLGDVWKLLYNSANCTAQLKVPTVNGFCNGLCQLLMSLQMVASDYTVERVFNNSVFLSFFGEVAKHVVKQIKLLDNNKQGSGIKNAIELVRRFLRILQAAAETSNYFNISIVTRIFAAMACFVTRLSSKQDVLVFIEVMSDALVPWLSPFPPTGDGMRVDDLPFQLQELWTKMLHCIERNLPLAAFDSSFLKILSPLLGVTFDHRLSSISYNTITFWNSTYGKQSILNYPESLLPVLDKLSKVGKIKVPRRSSLVAGIKNASDVALMDDTHPNNGMAVKNRSSALEAEFVEETEKDNNEHVHYLSCKLSTKRLKMEIGGGLNLEPLGFKRQIVACHPDEELRTPESIMKMLRRKG